MRIVLHIQYEPFMPKRKQTLSPEAAGRMNAQKRSLGKNKAVAKKAGTSKKKTPYKPLAKFNPRLKSATEASMARASTTSAGASVPCQIQKIVIDGTDDQGPGFVCIGSSITLRAISDPECPSKDISWKITTQPSGSNVSDPPKGETAIITPTKKGQYVIEADCDKSSASFNLGACEIQLDAPTQGQEFKMSMGDAASGPTMPKVTLTVADPCPGYTSSIQVKFTVGDTNAALIYEDYPRNGNYQNPPAIDSSWLVAGTLSWDINWGSDIYGGHITQFEVALRANGQDLCSKTISRDVWILGNQLVQSLFDAYIATKGLTAQETIMVRAITKVEGFGSPTQFEPNRTNELSNAFHYRYPLYESAHGGYGLFQLTNPVPNRDEIWNWKRNVDTGIVLLRQKIQDAKDYLNTHPQPPITDLQIRLESYAHYNGGFFHVWQNNQWIEDPRFVCGCNNTLRKGIEKVIPPNPQPPVGTCRPIAQCYAEYAHSLE
jgi:hypothetical protein